MPQEAVHYAATHANAQAANTSQDYELSKCTVQFMNTVTHYINLT